MGETTDIAWTDSTINVWHGCHKVSAGCANCYAEVSTPVRVKRAAGLEVWGANAARSETKGWEANLRKWDRARRRAIANPDRNAVPGSGRPWLVFGQSLSDTFEDYSGDDARLADGTEAATLDGLRARFFAVIEECSALTFQLLTKRPENILRMVPPSWRIRNAPKGSALGWPAHVWIGCTVEDQQHAEERIPHLLRVPAAVRFLSVEPQIGPVDLRLPTRTWTSDITGQKGCAHCCNGDRCDDASHYDRKRCPYCRGTGDGSPIAWVIQGGESGPKARPFDLAWARSLRDQCRAARRAAGVAYFLKQLGAHAVEREAPGAIGRGLGLRDSHGGDESEWPADLQGCRAFPEAP